jgi:hypothetical protein
LPPPPPSSSRHGPRAALNEASRLRKVHPTGDLAPLATLLAAPAIRTAAIPLVDAWKLQPVTPSLVLLASDPATSAADRIAALAARTGTTPLQVPLADIRSELARHGAIVPATA